MKYLNYVTGKGSGARSIGSTGNILELVTGTNINTRLCIMPQILLFENLIMRIFNLFN